MNILIDCPEADLGTLHHGDVRPHANGVKIHGVDVPHHVASQLKTLRPLESFSRDELHAAIHAAAADGVVFDDLHGDNFHDMLHLTDEERHAQTCGTFCDEVTQSRRHAGVHGHHCDD